MSDLGNVYITLSQWDKAAKFLSTCYLGRKTKLGHNHPDTISGFENLEKALNKRIN